MDGNDSQGYDHTIDPITGERKLVRRREAAHNASIDAGVMHSS